MASKFVENTPKGLMYSHMLGFKVFLEVGRRFSTPTIRNFGISNIVTFSAIVMLVSDHPVESIEEDQSTRQKPSLNT